MKNNNKRPELYFAFANDNNKVKPVFFTEPKEVILATTIEKVIPALQKVQQAVNHGSYAAGYITYEAAPAFNESYTVVARDNECPLLWFGIFDSPSALPHMSEKGYTMTNWIPDVTKSEYHKNFFHIQEQINNNVTNQVNYTIRMRSQFKGDDFSFFQQLKKAQASNYTCFVQTEQCSILSASPELFFYVKNEKITTRPMAGTIKRGKSYDEDVKNLKKLRGSVKNKTENKMIVDLIQKDLERIAKPGMIKIPKLFEIEHYPTVFQMTSTVTAELLPKTDIADIFTALFPSASMTGDPKNQTMEIIADVESSPRGVYSGAIGYMTPDGEAIFNVPIRTVVINRKTRMAEYGVGGGITENSTYDDEYNEILTKAALLTKKMPQFQLLESMRLENGDYFILEEHMDRLRNSAHYFNIPIDYAKIEAALHDYAERQEGKVEKVRLLLSQQGEISIGGKEIFPAEQSQPFILAKEPIVRDDIFLYHKTTNRELYEKHQTTCRDVYDVLLWNEDGELTEFTNGNLVVEMNGKLYTPPLESGLLPGTFRANLLKGKKLTEKVLRKEDLAHCAQIWLINSVRKWVPVYLLNK